MNNNPLQSEIPITDDPSVLLGIYSAQSAAQLDYNERKWETVRSVSLLTLGLLAGVGAIAASEVAHSMLVLALLGALLWVFGIAIYFWTIISIRREAELQYNVEFSMYQIEKLLGAHGVVPDKSQWLPPYRYIFEEKHLSFEFVNIDPNEYKKDPVKAWVNGRIKKHKFLKLVRFYSLILLFIFVLVGGLLLIIALWGSQLQPAFNSGTPILIPTCLPTQTP